ncbi:MAG: hypothetical protein KatS3mg003_1827 [Candidatus Nitrosocaldaceae archaeon]|nr:MAG: hypothetical protein KatS3mg003_1827 [Candidatus Nitrosocaldaceae archaeon]
MSNYSSLRRTVEKVVSQAEEDFVERINSSYNDALNNLRSSRNSLESEYNRIIEDANKQAENLKRQIIGSSSIEARNKQLLIVEDAVNKVFEEVKKKINTIRNKKEYKDMLNTLLEDAVKVINDDIIVECNKDDMSIIKDLASNISNVKITVSNTPTDILGGLKARSKDGSIVYENTLERRIERLKPLIKKDIVGLFTK